MDYKSVLKYILSLAIAGLLLYLSFRGVGWNEFVEGIKACRWEFILLAATASILAFYFRSLRWRILIRPMDPTMDALTTFNGVNIGYLANFAFPRIGEVIRCGFISRRSRKRHAYDPQNAVSFENVAGTVLLSRTWDLMVIFILIGVLLVMRWDKFGAFFADALFARLKGVEGSPLRWILAGAIAAGIAAIYAMYLLRDRSKFVRRIADFAKGMANGFKSCIKMQDKGAFFIYTVLLWAMYWLMSMSIVWALPQLSEMNWVDGWFLCLAGSVAWIIPVPGGFGAYHGVVALAMTTIYAMGWNDGLLYATLNHETQSITMILCGTISYFIETFRK